MQPQPFVRSTMIEALRSAAGGAERAGGRAGGASEVPFDVVVIGGGITGAGVALDAANRGLRTVLLERDDFAGGTSSKSSKFVHGGLRYLQNGEVRLVYEALHERRRLMRNAPHLVEVLPFLIPILTRDGVVSKKIARGLGSAMWMYDVTGGWRIGRVHHRVSAEQAAAYFPTADAERMSAGYLYFDARADDARLTLTIARTAAQHGALVLNRARATGIDHDPDGRACGVRVELDGTALAVPARVVVLAGGVWTDELRALDEPTHPSSIRPAKGTHIVVPWGKVRNTIAVIIPVKRDRRSLFLTPWGENADGTFRHTYIGTTDTAYDGPLDDPRCDADDIDYMLEAVNQAVTEPILPSDITGAWAGLRPLVAGGDDDGGDGDGHDDATTAKTADLSRRHVVAVSGSGVVRVNGGKLTTYRKMAEDTVDRVLDELGRSRLHRSRGSTRRLPLLGAGKPPQPADAGSLDAHLYGRYGTLAAEIKALAALYRRLDHPLVEGQPYLRAEAVYAVRHEMATTLDDVLCRRTRAHLFDRAACAAAAPDVADLLAEELGWDRAERDRQLDRYRAICAEEEAADERVAHAAD
jgi:glycerol-3-phosphate dehydrogenase